MISDNEFNENTLEYVTLYNSYHLRTGCKITHSPLHSNSFVLVVNAVFLSISVWNYNDITQVIKRDCNGRAIMSTTFEYDLNICFPL